MPIMDSIEKEIFADLVCGSLITAADAVADDKGGFINKFVILIACGSDDCSSVEEEG